MNERWIDELRAESAAAPPRAGFRDELRAVLTAEWDGGPAPMSSPRHAAPPQRPSRWMLGVAAAVVALLVGGLVVVARLDRGGTSPGDLIDGAPPPELTTERTTVDTIDETTERTEPAPGATDVPESSSPSTPSALSPTVAEQVKAALQPQWDQVTVDAEWANAGIPRTCGAVWWEQQQIEHMRCTQLVVSPEGVPVTFDPTTRTVARHTRSGGPITFALPADLVDPNLIAVGPDDVAYFALDNEWPKASDVVAVSVAPVDAGAVLERFREVMGIGDADVFVTPDGLVLSGWHAEGLRPEPDAVPFVRWIRRADAETSGSWALAPASFDDGLSSVGVGGWQWRLLDRLVVPEQPGSGRVMNTFDGGFVGSYAETTNDLRLELFRGHRDGTVEHWIAPGSWAALGSPILEPQGTFLFPNGETFVRVAPFAAHPTGWERIVKLDVDAGLADAVGLNDYFDSAPVAPIPMFEEETLPWGLGPTAIADAIAGPLGSPAEVRTIAEPAGRRTATVTTEGFLDDSVFGERFVVHLTVDGRVERIDWSQTCQPGRGHQDYRAELCV